MSRFPTAAEKVLLRTQPFRSKFYMVIEQGTELFTAKVNDGGIGEGETVIAYDGDSGEDDVLLGMTLFNKALDDIGNEKGSARIKSIDTGAKEITLEPNSIDWADDEDLLVDGVMRLYRILPKITAGVVKEDEDKTYSDQNDRGKRKPVALMGSPRYAWTGEAKDFYGWRSYAKAYNVDGERYGISAYQWDFDGGAVVAGGTTLPGTPSSPNSVKWNTPGERHFSLEVTDDNGNIHKAYRLVKVVDRPGQGDDPPYEDFEIELLEGDWDSGEWRASVTVTGDATPSDFPNNALGILFCEDWYGGTKQSIGGWFGQEDILLCAYVIEDSVRQDAETGDVTFEIASIVNQLKEIDVWPLNFKDVDGSPGGWHEFKNMTVEDVFWHIVEEHTTLKNIADVFVWTGVTGGKRIDFVDITEAPVYDQLDQQLLSAIFGHLTSSRYSSVHGNRNFNMLNIDQRVQVGRVMMNLEKQDRLDDLEIAGERHRDAVCQVDFIGFIYDANGDPIEVYSLAPERQKNFGRVEKETGILLTGATIAAAQDEADELAGLYLAYQNIRFPSVTLKIGNYRIFEPSHQDLVGLAVQAADTPRGYDWYDAQTGRAKEFIVRRVGYEIDHEGGYMTAVLGLEASTWGKDGTSGPYPPIPPPDDDQPEPPPWPPPPISDGMRMIVATNPYGVAVCADRFASPPIWTALNDGLTGDDLKIVDLILDPWDPQNTAFICTETGDVFRNTNIFGGGSWTRIWDASADWPGGVTGKAVRVRKGMLDQNFVLIAAQGNAELWVIHSHDDGGDWPTSVQLTNPACVFWPTRCMLATAGEVGGSLIASTHDADVVFVSGMSGLGVSYWMSPTVWKSPDKAHTFPVLQYERDHSPAATNKCVPIKVPYHNNPSDDKILVGCWYIIGAKKGPYYVEDGLADDPTAADEFSGFPGGHTLVDDVTPPRGSHGIATWDGGHVKLFTVSGGAYYIQISLDGGDNFTGRVIEDPATNPFKMRCNTTLPYDPNVFAIGRAETTTNYLVMYTQNGGEDFVDFTANLRAALGAVNGAPYPEMRITGIVFDWLTQ